MKIVKEVIIKATITDTWALLTSDETLKGLMNSKDGALRLPAFPGSAKIVANPPRKLSVNGGAVSPEISTIFELSERGNHTGLKVTICGWESLDLETARLEMPQVSLHWEKKLGLLKKSIESAAGVCAKA
ncbi:MAG TPA: hypothetical protein DEO84_12205 [candidate division Zixibacteria bacterium]|nr:hypothetical protein [candidate division Zixibacteria bacterium]HBZ02071.1 hypothetical protein [candidate division Zixibacteria bacterium]